MNDPCEKYDNYERQKEAAFANADYNAAQAELDWKRQFYTRFAASVVVSQILVTRMQAMNKRITRQHKTRQVKVLQRVV